MAVCRALLQWPFPLDTSHDYLCSPWKNEYCRELQSLLEKGKAPLTSANILAHKDPGLWAQQNAREGVSSGAGSLGPYGDSTDTGRFGTQNKCVFCVQSGHSTGQVARGRCRLLHGEGLGWAASSLGSGSSPFLGS